MNARLTPGQRDEVARRYSAGESPGEIAPAFGVSRECIVSLVRSRGIARTKQEALALAADKRHAQRERDGKRCCRCRTVKPLTEFYERRGRRNGRVAWCKACNADIAKHRQARPYNAAQARLSLLASYGLTEAQYEEMLRSQGGGCAICGRPPGKRPLCVDHCHDTRIVRGLLCSPCNRAIGHLGDNAAGLRRAVAYLETPRQLRLVS